MVSAGWLCLLAQQEQPAPLEALDPPRRSAVMMALLGILLVGLMMVIAVMVASRWLRRVARERPEPRDWSREPNPWEAGRDNPNQVLPDLSDGPSAGDTYTDPPPEDTVAE